MVNVAKLVKYVLMTVDVLIIIKLANKFVIVCASLYFSASLMVNVAKLVKNVRMTLDVVTIIKLANKCVIVCASLY